MKKIKKTEEYHPLTWRLRKDEDPVWFNEYSSKNGYVAAKNAILNLNSENIIQLISESGLKGRGGAGFPTGLKWSLVSKNSSKEQIIYFLCNADEMEPGTFKDRLLMEQIPHLLLEGMIIGGYALKAFCGYIFLRGEYIKAENNLNHAILEAKEKKILGKNIFNSNFDFEIFIHTGAGRYICGEETALINSLEGKRPIPRSKPPFPGNFGLWGKPTCVNNVETIANIPAIILNGVKWYKNISKSKNDFGTKMVGFSGKVKNPGVWEVPFGITFREIFEEYAGGMKNNFQLKAWLPGGAGTAFLLESHLDLKIEFDTIMNAGSRLGTALSIAIDNEINIVSLLLNLEIFFARESCGWCTPCREGLPWIVKILKSIKEKKGFPGDIELLEEHCENLRLGRTFCAHAPGAVEPLKSAIKYFRKEFELGITSIHKKNFFLEEDFL